MSTIEPHIADMADKEDGGIDSFAYNNFLKETVSICSGPLIQGCDAIWTMLDADRQADAYREDWGRHAGLVDYPANSAGRQRYRLVQFRHDGTIFLAAMTLRVERQHATEAAASAGERGAWIADALKLDGSEPDAVITDKIDRLSVFVIGGPLASGREIETRIGAILANGHLRYSPAKIFDVGQPYFAPSGDWHPGQVDIGNRLHALPEFGNALAAALGRLAARPAIDAIVGKTREVVDRHWMLSHQELAHSVPPLRLAIQAAKTDWFIPGPMMQFVCERLDEANLLGASTRIATHGETLAGIIESGDLPADTINADGEYVANDGRDVAKLERRGAGQSALSLRTADWRASLTINDAEITIAAVRQGQEHREFQATISRTDPARLLSGAVPHDIDSIRTVNGLKSSIASLVCCARLDLHREPAGQPAP